MSHLEDISVPSCGMHHFPNQHNEPMPPVRLPPKTLPQPMRLHNAVSYGEEVFPAQDSNKMRSVATG